VESFTDLLCGVLKKFIAGDRGNTALDVERPETALCSRWLTVRRMGEDAPKRTSKAFTPN
jgi:hypothetical protein